MDGARRQDREREFHDRLFAEIGDARDETGRFYEIVAGSQSHYWDAVMARATASDCVEYGCSYGASTIRVAETAASAVGFDISGVVIDKAREAAAAAGSTARFEVGEAETLPFADATFDLAFGTSVLHHLELEPALAEMSRILRPSGSAVFLEPLGHNRLINWYRDRTPGMRTPDEHPLMKSDFALVRRYFTNVEVSFFHLAALGAVVRSGKRGFRPLLGALDQLDRLLLAPASPLRYQAWICVMELTR